MKQNLSGLLRGHSLMSRSDVMNPKERPKRDHEFETSYCKSHCDFKMHMYLWNWIVIEKQTADLKAYKLLWTSSPKLWQVNSPHYTLCISLTPDLRIGSWWRKRSMWLAVIINYCWSFLGLKRLGACFQNLPTFPPRKMKYWKLIPFQSKFTKNFVSTLHAICMKAKKPVIPEN